MLTKSFIISSICVDKQKCLLVLFSKKKSRYEEKLKEIFKCFLSPCSNHLYVGFKRKRTM